MNRVIPEISSGSMKLVISETLCFNPMDGLKMHVQTANQKTGKIDGMITFNFIFHYDPSLPSEAKTSIEKQCINIHITNFGIGTLHSGLTNNLAFNVGGTPISMSFFGALLINGEDEKKKMLHFTVSVFQGGN